MNFNQDYVFALIVCCIPLLFFGILSLMLYLLE